MITKKTSSDPDLFDSIESEEERKVREKEERKAAEIAERKERLLRHIATRQFDTLETRVAYILAQFPDTRNSDITLQIQYWSIFQSEKVQGGLISLPDLYDLERLTSLSRARATIQNVYQLYIATNEEVAKKRQQLSEEYREKHKPINMDVPPVAIYADESGKNQANLIVGSVWVLAPSEEYRLYREMTEWKEETGFSYELKFNNISKTNKHQYREFLERFVVQEGVLGFKAIAMKSGGISDDGAAFADLYYFLVRRGIEHENNTGRASLPRRITFVKDAEEIGYDERLLALFSDRMANASESIFEGKLTLELAYAEESKSYIFLQVADLFTGCINRVINSPAPTKGWKDEFAEEILGLLGMEKGLDVSDTLNDRTVRLSLHSSTITDGLVNT